MSVINSNNAPDVSVVKPHFIFGSIALLILSVMIILADTNLLEAYFNTKILAITHMAVLGWASMIVFGALYQLIPVVFETSLYSEKLAKFTFWAFGFSILFLTYTFWVGAFSSLLIYSSLLTFSALLLFVINIILSYRKSKKKNTSSKFIITAIIWLGATELIGTLIAFNFKYNFLTEIHLHYLKIHATIGLIGWFLLLIIGVGSTLIPMFLVSHELNENKLKKAYVLINVGLLALSLNWFFIHYATITPFFWLAIVVGVLFFLSFVLDAYNKRIRKKLDIGMKHTMISILSVLLPIIISLIVLIGFDMEHSILMRVTTLYGFTIIFGFITTLILGQTYKTLPFVIWLEKYKGLVGKTKTLLPRELYSENIAKGQFYLYLVFIVCMVLGLILNNIWLIRAGSYALLIVSILYNINVFKIVFHKVKTIKK